MFLKDLHYDDRSNIKGASYISNMGFVSVVGGLALITVNGALIPLSSINALSNDFVDLSPKFGVFQSTKLGSKETCVLQFPEDSSSGHISLSSEFSSNYTSSLFNVKTLETDRDNEEKRKFIDYSDLPRQKVILKAKILT